MNALHRILVILILAITLPGCGEKEVSSEEHFAQAKLFISLSNYRAAIPELKSALHKDITNSRARSLLGKIYFDLGEYENAVKELSKAYDSGVDPTVVVPVLAKALLSLGEFQQLEDLKLDGLDPEGRSIVQAAKGLSMLYDGNFISSAEFMRTAMENDPRSPYAEVAAARLTMANQDYKGARAQLKAVFETHPEYVPAWNLLGDVEAAEKRPKKAHEAYTQALKFAPRTFDARLNRLMMRIYLGNFTTARKDMAYLKSNFGGVVKVHPGVLFAQGLLSLHSGFIDPARIYFEKAAEFSDAYPLSYYYMAAIDLEKGGLQQALNNVYRFLAYVPSSVAGAKLAARIEWEEKNYRKVVKLLRRVVEIREDDVEALNLLASALLAQGKSGEGVELLARVAQLEPDSIPAKARLGAGYLAAGRDARGVLTLRNVLKAAPEFEQADILLVLNFLRKGQNKQAIEAALAYSERNPESATSYNLLGRAYLGAQQNEDAAQAFSRALKIRPGDPGANHALAEFALQDNNYSLARLHYQKVLDENPEHIQSRMKIVGSYAMEGKEEAMLQSLEDALREQPRSMEPHLVKARYFIARGELEKAGLILHELSAEQQEHPDALATLASFELATKRYNQAFYTLEKLMRIRTDVSQYHYLRARAFAGLGNMEGFTAELERALELDPGHFYAKIALARLARINGNNEKFETLLTQLMEVAPENPDVMKLEVLSAQQRGADGRAGELLDTLARQSPNSANMIALASHRESVGNTQGAIVLLNHWLENHPDDVKAREKLASLYSSSGQFEAVLEQYGAILREDEFNIVALNNLAWHLLEDRPEEALEYAERVYALSPDSSSILDTLALALMKNGKLAEARRIIDRALELAPRNPDIGFHEAQLRLAEGDEQGAIEVLTTILERRPRFEERADAEAFLENLKKS